MDNEDLLFSGIPKKRNRVSKYPSTEISETFKELIQCHPYSESTKKNYDDRIRKLLCILTPTTTSDFVTQLLSGEETLERIKSSELSSASQIEIVKAIPCIYKILAGVELTTEEKAPYVKAMMLNGTNYMRQKATEKRDPLPTFMEFLERVKTEYGEDSEEFLLMSLYSELTCRDNFCQILLLPRFDGRRTNANYLIINNSEPVTAVINCHKTVRSHGPLKMVFSNCVSNRVKKYINTHKLQYQDCLFPQSSLSSYVARVLERCGLSGAISTLRDMRVSENVNDPSKTGEDLQELARSMGHSVQTACCVYYRPVSP